MDSPQTPEADQICDLRHQNHELKKKLIRIEVEAKKERAQLLMQFEQMKSKIEDVESKEKFLKNSQHSLNELVLKLHSNGDREAPDDHDGSSVTQKILIKRRTDAHSEAREEPRDSDTSFQARHDGPTHNGEPPSDNFMSNSNILFSASKVTKDQILRMHTLQQKSSNCVRQPDSLVPSVKSQGTMQSSLISRHFKAKQNSPVQLSPEFKKYGASSLDFTSAEDANADLNAGHRLSFHRLADSQAIETADLSENEDLKFSRVLGSNFACLRPLDDREAVAGHRRHPTKHDQTSAFAQRKLTDPHISKSKIRVDKTTAHSRAAAVLKPNQTAAHQSMNKRKSQRVLYNDTRPSANRHQTAHTSKNQSIAPSFGSPDKSARSRDASVAANSSSAACRLRVNNINIDFVRGKIGIKLEHAQNMPREKSSTTSRDLKKNLSQCILGEPHLRKARHLTPHKTDCRSFASHQSPCGLADRSFEEQDTQKTLNYFTKSSRKPEISLLDRTPLRKDIEINDCKDLSQTFATSWLDIDRLQPKRSTLRSGLQVAKLQKNNCVRPAQQAAQQLLKGLAKPLEPPKASTAHHRADKRPFEPTIKPALKKTCHMFHDRSSTEHTIHQLRYQ